MNIEDLVKNKQLSTIEKLFTMALWKISGKTPVVLTSKDVEQFTKAFDLGEDKNNEAKLFVQGTEDGIVMRVFTSQEADAFLADYKAKKRGVVVQ